MASAPASSARLSGSLSSQVLVGASALFKLQPLGQVRGDCRYRFNLHFLMIDNTEHIFMYSFAVHISSLVMCLVTYFAHFLKLFVFLLLTSFYILDINSLSDTCFANIFSQLWLVFWFSEQDL